MDDPRTRDKNKTLRPNEATEIPEFTRVSGEMICKMCGRKYINHPHAMEFLDWQGHPYLRRLCNGKLVKL